MQGVVGQYRSFRGEALRSCSLGGVVVVQAYVLIQTEVGKAAKVAESIAGISGVTVAEDVTGPYDVIARVEARTVDDLGHGDAGNPCDRLGDLCRLSHFGLNQNVGLDHHDASK